MAEKKLCGTCGSEYSMNDERNDDGFCSYPCWEQKNIGEIKKATDEFAFDISSI
jgi:hypothetical protein